MYNDPIYAVFFFHGFPVIFADKFRASNIIPVYVQYNYHQACTPLPVSFPTILMSQDPHLRWCLVSLLATNSSAKRSIM